PLRPEAALLLRSGRRASPSGFLPLRPDPALLLRSGRSWREAPDEGAGEASRSCPSRQHQKHASLRSRPLIRPPGTFSRKREQGSSIRFLPLRPDPALLLRSGRRWRVAPDEGASGASCSCPSRQHQKHASLRSRPLIRPPGTFSRKREEGFSIRFLPLRPDPALRLRSGGRWREAPDEGASEAGRSCPSRQHQTHASAALAPPPPPPAFARAGSPGTFSREREKGFLPISRRKVRDQPFSCEAGEGGAKRRMRARAKRAALALPRQRSKARFAALAPPHPPSGHLLPQAGEGLPPHLSPQGSGSSPSPAKREKVARSAG